MRLALPSFLFVFLAACGTSMPDAPVDGGDGDASATPDGADRALKRCDADPINGASCGTDKQACEIPNGRCDCVFPERVWVCCAGEQSIDCPHTEAQAPFSQVGQPCCVGDFAPVLGSESWGCGLCYHDGHKLEVTCASADRHFRVTQGACAYPSYPDAGTDAGGGYDGGTGAFGDGAAPDASHD